MKTKEKTNRPGEYRTKGIHNADLERMAMDFGTYHHSTPEESKALRDRAAAIFATLLKELYPPETPLQILDAGCGLGFLMYVAAQCFPKAHITGVDLFTHDSVSEMSMRKATANMRSLGIESRTSFLKQDLTKPFKTATRFDLAVSHVVFHNMGKNRFKAYETVFNLLKPGGFFIIGDLFPHDDADTECFREHSTQLKELHEGNFGSWAYRIKVLRANT